MTSGRPYKESNTKHGYKIKHSTHTISLTQTIFNHNVFVVTFILKREQYYNTTGLAASKVPFGVTLLLIIFGTEQ